MEERRQSLNFARHMKHSSLSPRAKKHSTVKLIAMLAILIILILLMLLAGCSAPNLEVECSKAERTAAEFLTSNLNRNYAKMRELSTQSLDSLIAAGENQSAAMNRRAKELIANITKNLEIKIDSSYTNEQADTAIVFYTLKVKKTEKTVEANLKSAKIILLKKSGEWKVDAMK